jgi:hypothetical protein
MLSIVELVIGLSFAIRIFSSNITSDGGLLDFTRETLSQMGDGVSVALGGLDMSGSLAFLLLILGFMLFSFILIAQVPRIINQSKRSLEIETEWE